MDDILKRQNIDEYAEEYFEKDEDLKSNFCAITDEKLIKKLKEVPLKKRLQWVVRSEHKDVHADPFQFNLFSTFDSEEIATVLLAYHQDDKDRLVDAKFYSKMPSYTMQSLFLRKEAIDDVENDDIVMLAEEYSKSHPNTIFDFMTKNDEALNVRLFNELYKKLPTKKQMYDIDEMYGEKMTLLEMWRSPKEPKGR
ncbi:MAG: hypothetical protein PHX40_03480 [Bacilli bacterium]|nr:hypothetical protein [Bacilli bacterium]